MKRHSAAVHLLLSSFFCAACAPSPAAAPSSDAVPAVVEEEPLPDAVCSARSAALDDALAGADVGGSYAIAIDDDRCGAIIKTSGVDPDDLHRVGSVTKTYVAAATLSLVESGALDLDTVVDDVVPASLGLTLGAVTVRMLLQHQSGLGDYLDNDDVRGEALRDPAKRWSLEELVRAGLALAAEFSPGTSWSYSNTNYVALGIVLEAVTGQDWSDVVVERAIERVGLTRTFIDDGGSFDDALAPGTFRGADVTFALHPSFSASSGAIIATPADGAHWIRRLYTSDDVLGDELRSQMLEPAPESGGAYGLGTEIFTVASAGIDAVGHTGSIPGYVSDAFYLPDVGVGAFIVVDDGAGDVNDLFVRVLTALEII